MLHFVAAGEKLSAELLIVPGAAASGLRRRVGMGSAQEYPRTGVALVGFFDAAIKVANLVGTCASRQLEGAEALK